MKVKKLTIKMPMILFMIIASLSVNAQIDPGQSFNLQNHINQKIANLPNGETEITLTPGRYRVSPAGNKHLRLENLNNITINAYGVEMICTETVQAIQIRNCNNLTIKGLSVDYDPLPFTQGRITGISGNKLTLYVDMLDGYSDKISWDKLEIFDPATGELSTTTYFGVTNDVVNAQQRKIRIDKPARFGASISTEKVGDIIVLDSDSGQKASHAIEAQDNTNLILQDVILYAGPTFGFYEQRCSNSRYINCAVKRRPLATDVRAREVRRMKSNNADAFHSKFATVGPKYIGCTAVYNGDDGFAINGSYHLIMDVNGNQLTVLGKAKLDPNLSIGDPIELVTFEGERIEDAVITGINTSGPKISESQKTFLDNLGLKKASATLGSWNGNMWIVTIDRPESTQNLPMGSLIAASNKLGNGFEVRNCTLGYNRSQGIIAKGSDGIIDNNTITGNWKSAIKVGPGYVWLEAGSSNNVSITNNTITRSRESAIVVYTVGGNGNIGPIGGHENITITGNNISYSINPGIAVTSTRDLFLANNTITNPENDYYTGWFTPNFGHNQDKQRKIYTISTDETTTPPTPPPTTASLEVKLLFNEASGQPLNTGENPQVSAEKNGSASLFNTGVNDSEKGNVLYMNSNNNAEVLLKEGSNNYSGPTGGQARTFAYWVKLDAMQFQTMLFSGGGGGNIFNLQMEVNGVMRVFDGNGNFIKMEDQTLTAGNWHHVALVLPQSGGIHDIQFYLDGSASNESNVGNNAAINTGDNILKLFPNFSGHVSDFRYYNYALTANEINDVFVGESQCTATGNITYQKWNGIAGQELSNLTSSPDFPNNPSTTTTLSSFEAPSNSGNGYGARIVGTVCAPETGTYYFWIAADDAGDLYLSSDATEANKTKIAFNNTWVGVRDWNEEPNNQKSGGTSLVAGQQYFIEALMKEGGGGDNLAVGWRKPSDGNAGVPSEVIPGSLLSPYTPPITTVFTVRARMTAGASDNLDLILNDDTVKTWMVTGSTYEDYIYTGVYNNENVKVYFPDNGTDVRVDYLKVGSETYQSELQSTNTGVWSGTTCGGISSEMLHCAGHIDFGDNLSGSSSRVVENESFVNTIQEIKVSIYPNPVKDFLNIDFPDNTLKKIKVYNVHGQVLFQEDTESMEYRMDVRQFKSKELLFIQIKSDEKTQVAKFIIE